MQTIHMEVKQYKSVLNTSVQEKWSVWYNGNKEF